ncbi:MAG TPA: DUF3311 domain-containing protein [Alphaproteobacteria bacterium]|nr:DUF3311 domain-containing protein [Alphaproteobacteria bacterium]
MAQGQVEPRRGSRWWYVLLAAPFVAMLWVSSYNKVEPTLWGFPFFYWYQFLWLIISAVLTWIVHRLVD